ncbi:MAG: hypothetical protein ABI650_10490, partial [Dokdonella sp.]
MENDITPELPAAATREPASPTIATSAPPRRGVGRLLVVIVVLAAIGALAWWLWQQQQREQGSARADALSTQLAELSRTNEQLRRDLDALRTRF